MPICMTDFRDVIQKAHRAQVMVVSPNILMLAINTIQTVMKDARMREQADLIRKEVGALLNDVRLLGERVGKLQTHFNQADADIKNILISTAKIVEPGREDRESRAGPAGSAEKPVLTLHPKGPGRPIAVKREATPWTTGFLSICLHAYLVADLSAVLDGVRPWLELWSAPCSGPTAPWI